MHSVGNLRCSLLRAISQATSVMERFSFIPLTPNLYEKAIDFTYEHVFPREPLSVGRGYKTRDPCHIRDMLRKLSMGVSLAAIDKATDQLVGISMCSIVRKTDVTDCSGMSDDARSLYIFTDHVERGIDLFEKYQVNEAFDLYVLGVHSEYGGLGIARTLVDLSVKLAREKGFKFLRSNPTNPVTMHLYEKAGFETLSEARSKMFLDKSGKLLFPYAKENDCARLCVKLL